MATQHIMKSLRKAGARELIEIEAFISDLVQRRAVDVAFERRIDATETCVKCGSDKLQKWGRSAAGTQRFKCRDCSATFTATANTPFYRLRKRQLWTRYLALMDRHMPLRKLRLHGIPLHVSTLHRWRHRFLSVLTKEPEAPLAGLIEADEKFFRTSYKGDRGWKRGAGPQNRRARRRGNANVRGLGDQQVPTLTAIDRSGAIRQAQLPDMRWPTIEGTMAPWVETESVICSDGNLAYARVAKKAGCEHIVAKTGGHNTSGLSIGRIDAYHRDVENLVNRRCMGVSTRYLMNYFGWARRITQHKPFGNDLLAEMLAA